MQVFIQFAKTVRSARKRRYTGIFSVEEGVLQTYPSMKIPSEIAFSNCYILATYLIENIQIYRLDGLSKVDRENLGYAVLQSERFTLKMMKKYKPNLETYRKLLAYLYAVKLGGKVTVEYLLSERGSNFFQFIANNSFQNYFQILRQQLPFDPIHGPSIPINLNGRGPYWIPWEQLHIEEEIVGNNGPVENQQYHENSFHYTQQRKRKGVEVRGEKEFYLDGESVFRTDESFRMNDDFSLLYQGIQPYNMGMSDKFIAYDRQDPIEWGQRHVVEVWTFFSDKLDRKPSVFKNTHAFLVLRDDKGFVRSVGQDILVQIQGLPITEILSQKQVVGKIVTPDTSVFYSEAFYHFEKTRLPISKESHDRIIQIIERDKRDGTRVMSAMKNNCVSYAVKILEEGAGLNYKASMYCAHIFIRVLVPARLYNKFKAKVIPWYARRSHFTQKAIHFFPPFYLFHLLMLTIGLIFQRNSHQNECDVKFKSGLFRPWEIEVDHPISLVRVMKEPVIGPNPPSSNPQGIE